MALFLFTKAILDGVPIDVYNDGKMQRDFTYVDDIVEGVVRVLDRIPQPVPELAANTRRLTPAESAAPYTVYNIGNHNPVELLYFIEVLEKALGKDARKNFLPLQPGDVPSTFADVEALMRDVGFKPATSIEVGIGRFIEWYRSYYKV